MNRFVLSVSLLLCSLFVQAQGMSDTQVMQYVQREVKAGTSQAQIATKLMQRGVTMQQLQRVRRQMSSSSASSGSSVGDSDAGASRLRQANGSVRTDEVGNALASGQGVSTVQNFSTGMSDMTSDLRPQVYIPDTTDNTINGKEVFGRNIFNKKNLSFEPAMNIATPASYVVGPGDKVNVDIYGASQKSQTLEVSPDGVIVVDGFGPIHIAGLSVSAANARIKEQLGARYASSNIRLTVGQTRTVMVHVMGEVAAPGSYTLSAFGTVFNALYMAGGVNGLGTLRDIKVYRNGKLLSTVDVYDYLLNGKLTGNVRLQDNDVIIVGPYQCIVEVQGFVKRPMAYEMKPSESVATLLRYAGGFANKAYTKAVHLNRTAEERRSGHNISEFELADFRLADGDVVVVDSILERYENTAEIRGAVFHPGKFNLDANQTVRTLIESAGGLTEDAFMAHAVIHRVKADRTKRAISVDLQGIMDGTAPDVNLENEDMLLIPFRLEAMTDRVVKIHGEVQFPGEYEFADDETIEDLILLAGGLTEAASTARVDVSRRIVKQNATTTEKEIAQTFSFTLKDGFVVDGDRSFTLKPYDEVYVRRSPGYIEQRNVEVQGEVLFAGAYTLNKKNLRLSDLIKEVGGVTDQAYVRGARVERLMTPDEIFRNRQVLKLVRLQGANMGLNSNQMDIDESIRQEAGESGAEQGSVSEVLGDTIRYTVGIELDKAIDNPGSDYDIILREGDRLVVPEYNGTVKINGNVMYPNTVAYSSGKKYKYYVNQAGGFGNRSKKSRAFVVYQNGTVSKAKNAKIEPGCEIIVPSKTTSTQEVISTIGSIGTSMATIVTLLVSVLNLLK